MERYYACLIATASCLLLSLLTACWDDDHSGGPILPYTGDGASPSGLIQGSDVNFYGTTANG
jgi:hypothetical protein